MSSGTISSEQVQAVADRIDCIAVLCRQLGEGMEAEDALKGQVFEAAATALDHEVAVLFALIRGDIADGYEPFLR